jgi:hypothetical protein
MAFLDRIVGQQQQASKHQQEQEQNRRKHAMNNEMQYYYYARHECVCVCLREAQVMCPIKGLLKARERKRKTKSCKCLLFESWSSLDLQAGDATQLDSLPTSNKLLNILQASKQASKQVNNIRIVDQEHQQHILFNTQPCPPNQLHPRRQQQPHLLQRPARHLLIPRSSTSSRSAGLQLFLLVCLTDVFIALLSLSPLPACFPCSPSSRLLSSIPMLFN